MNNIESLLVEIRDLLVLMTEQKKTRKRVTKVKSNELYTLAFEKAWGHYPKRTNKMGAAKAYKDALERVAAQRPDLVMSSSHESYILQKIKLYEKAWPKQRVKDEGNYCLHMSTFLNQDRFEDDHEQWKQNSNEEFGGPRWIELD